MRSLKFTCPTCRGALKWPTSSAQPKNGRVVTCINGHVVQTDLPVASTRRLPKLVHP